MNERLTMSAAEYACVFVRPPKERLAAAERLLRALPAYLGAADAECDLHRCAASSYLAAIVRAPAAAFGPDAIARLGFWTARTGARGFLVGGLSEADLAWFRAEVALCEKVVKGTPLRRLAGVARRFFADLGVPSAASAAPPELAVDLDGPGSEGLRYRPDFRALFVAGVLAPPRGDQLAIAIRDRRTPAPVEGWATVVEVRPRERATAGNPAGFTLRIEGPSAAHDLLARHAADRPRNDARSAPRYPVKAPVKVTQTAPAPGKPAAVAAVQPGPGAAAARAAPAQPAAAPAPRRPPLRARVAYASEQELAADWIENLSHGGAFVRTPGPLPEGTEVVLELALPDGARLEAKGAVAFVNVKGMGIRFVLSPAQDDLLSAAIARISARPRRALVVDDDALIRMILTDALTARGFEVICAADGELGLRTLSEELLALDVLVTDARMPGMDGETFIRTIRKAGGEADLAIVAITGAADRDLERRLEAAGADAVLEKSLGPELIAQAADAVLERKRMAQQAAADAA